MASGAHCHRRSHLQPVSTPTVQHTRRLDGAPLAAEAVELFKASIKECMKEFLSDAHVQDLAALASLLSTWYFLDNPNLLDAVESVFPPLKKGEEGN